MQREENDIKAQWCEEIGIKVFEFFVESLTGIKVTNGSYENVNGLYMCTPMLNGEGFNTYNTRYLKLNNSGNLVPDNWINKTPPDDWYDYSNQKWANIYVENGGIDSYFVWIPRYVYKQDTTKTERIDAKFVNLDNVYKDGITEQETTWAELQAQGYMLPEAFKFADTDLPGYWISKYQLSEFTTTSTYPMYFETTSTPTSIEVKNISTNSTNIAKYTYAINGKIVKTTTSPENYVFKDLAKGNKAINITGLDSNGSIVGSFTYLYKVAEVNAPDTTKFDPNTTFYVYYDEDGTEHNEIPISQPAPANWYDYSCAYWANIVTRNNGLETYYVWIPRYEFQINSTSQRTYVNFIKGTGTETTPGYSIPEAFTFGGQELTGFWISKYQLSIEESTPNINAEMSAGSSIIRVRDITGTKVADGLKYEYYINGNKVHEGTSATENYAYTGLTANKEYTINIIARNSTTNAYVGAVTRKVKTIEANSPDLAGFNAEKTYYVLYDTEGNMTIGDKIKNDGSNMPNGWYDYSNRKWANIVTTDGTVTNGQIAGATNTSYFVWIPRYEFRILSDRGNLSTANRRTEVNFLQGTSNEKTIGYQIPEAFKFADTELRGYWISKYQLSN